VVEPATSRVTGAGGPATAAIMPFR